MTLITAMCASGTELVRDLFEHDAELAKKGPTRRPLTASFQFKNQGRGEGWCEGAGGCQCQRGRT